MLIGEYKGRVADKNRVALPKNFREELNEELFITRGYENCLIIVDKKRWDDLIEVITEKPFLNKSVRDTKRFLVGGASEMKLDSQGRFVVPENLQNYAKIVKEIRFVGIIDWLEVWSEEIWEEKLKTLEKSASEIAHKLSISH